jgi:hypothetical protein
VQAFFQGANPYLVGEGFHKVYEPFWTFVLLLPFAICPFWIGRVLLFIVSLVGFYVSAIKMGANRWQAALFLLSSAVAGCLANGNLDWLVTMGLWMSPRIGLFFVLMKPQVGFGIAIFWMYRAWRDGGLRKVFRDFLPVTVAYLISFALYGFWPLQCVGMNTNPENMSAWPWVVPLGLFLVHRAVADNDRNLSIIAGPLLAPYASQFSYAAPLLALFSKPRLFLMAWVALWVPVLARLLM